MEIKTKDEASEYFKECVEHNMRCQKAEGKFPDREYAVKTEKSNLGYFAGYYDSETRRRVEELFECSHPIFGNVEPSSREALAAGMIAAKTGIKKAASIFQ